MRIFDTSVQELKNKILREIVRNAWNGNLLEGALDIPMKIIPGKKPTMRCCVYKERAIVAERVKIAINPTGRSLLSKSLVMNVPRMVIMSLNPAAGVFRIIVLMCVNAARFLSSMDAALLLTAVCA